MIFECSDSSTEDARSEMFINSLFMICIFKNKRQGVVLGAAAGIVLLGECANRNKIQERLCFILPETKSICSH